MLILSVVKNTEKLNDRVLLIRFIDGSTVTVDKFKNSVDIIIRNQIILPGKSLQEALVV